MMATEFTEKFDNGGRYRAGSGHEDVVFVSRNRRQFKGRLHFLNGLCVRAEMEGGGDWSYPDHSPLNEIRFQLQPDGDEPLAAAVNQGRLFFQLSPEEEASKKEFLANFRIARNLFAHAQFGVDGGVDDAGALEKKRIRSAIWLTPNSVMGFNAEHFSELGPVQQRDLDAAVKKFGEVAVRVPSDTLPTDEQYRHAAENFAKMLEILDPYLPISDEARKIEKALAEVGKEFPAWVLNWDFELGDDADGAAAVWVNIFADDLTAPIPQLGKYASEWTTKVRKALSSLGIARWPFMRIRTGGEHKSRT